MAAGVSYCCVASTLIAVSGVVQRLRAKALTRFRVRCIHPLIRRDPALSRHPARLNRLTAGRRHTDSAQHDCG